MKTHAVHFEYLGLTERVPRSVTYHPSGVVSNLVEWEDYWDKEYGGKIKMAKGNLGLTCTYRKEPDEKRPYHKTYIHTAVLADLPELLTTVLLGHEEFHARRVTTKRNQTLIEAMKSAGIKNADAFDTIKDEEAQADIAGFYALIRKFGFEATNWVNNERANQPKRDLQGAITPNRIIILYV